MKVFFATFALLGAFTSIAFSKNAAEKGSENGTGFVYEYVCDKNKVWQVKQDGVDPCERMIVAPRSVDAPAESEKKM